jgi:hypothetical protein
VRSWRGLAGREGIGPAEAGRRPLAEEVALLAEVVEVGVEGGDHLLEGGEAAVAAGGGEFERADAFDGAVTLFAGLAELFAQTAVFVAGGDDRADEGCGRKGRCSLGVGGDGVGVDLEEVGLLDAEPFEGGLEALDILPDLPDEPLGADVGAGGLALEGVGEAEAGSLLEEFVPCARGLRLLPEGDGAGARVGGFADGLLGG